MMNFTPPIIVFAFCIAAIQADCTEEEDSMPVMYNKETFLCAREWSGPGNSQPVQGCNSCVTNDVFDFTDGYDNGGTAYHDVGSLIVNPGCIFYGFSEREFEGTVDEFPAGLYSLVDAPNSPNSYPECANSFHSVKCKCQQKLVSCIPEDGWAVKLVCDAMGATQPVECSYVKTIGTSYTAEVSEDMAISAGVSAEITVGMFGLFGSTIGTSLETGYDWAQTSSETMGEEESFQTVAFAAPGRILHIEQAVGHCDGNDAQTELFKIYDVGSDGAVSNLRLQHHFKNGTVVDI